MPSTRACPACPEGPLSERGAPLCADCMRAAREPVPGTFAWPFDSPLMRRTLAGWNLLAVPAVFRATSGLSLYDLAGIVGRSRHTLGSYELRKRWGLGDFRAFRQFIDAVDMPCLAWLPLAFRHPDAALAGDGVLGLVLEAIGVDVDRRGFGGLAAGAAAAAMLPEITVPSRVGTAHVRYLETCADTLRRQDRKVGGMPLLWSGLRVWQRARRMLDESRYDKAIRCQLLGVTANLGLEVGWLARDSGDHGRARQLYSEAQTLAGAAGDTVLTVHVLMAMSNLSYDIARTGSTSGNHARDALLLAYKAAGVARRYPMPRLHALIALRHAGAASLLGDNAAFGSAITRARRELDKGPRTGDPEWIRHIGGAEITVDQFRGQAYLGDVNLDAAVAACLATLDDASLSPRNRARRRAQLASTLADGGDIASGISEGLMVLSSIEGGVRSVRTLNELRPVRIAAGPSRKSGAEEFRSRFDTAEQTLIAA